MRDFLTEEEVVGLTGKKRPGAQRDELKRMHIPFRERFNGTVVVVRSDLPILRSGSAAEQAVELNLDGV